MLRTRNVIFSIIMFSGFMVYIMSLQIFGPVYLTTQRGFTPGTVNLVMGAGGMAMSVIPAESVNALYAGLAIGLPVGIGELIGGFLNPAITGVLAYQYGLWIALVISSLGALVAGLVALGLQETAPRKVSGRALSEAAV